jgi:transcriptional regulator with XRE-family HTH domain
MASLNPEVDPKMQLGELLRLARDLQHKTQQDVAGILNLERTTVAKGETGKQVPSVRVLQVWLDGLEVTGLARTAIERMHRIARFLELDPAEIEAMPWFETEARAHSLRYWAPVIVPGIIQTPAYAEELFTAMRLSPQKIAEFMKIRLGRQAILTRDDAPDTTIVVWEHVLSHQIGTREVMRDQCARLLEVSDFPTVALHILPADNGANPGLGGAINLAATDDAPELLLSDGLVTDQLSQDPLVVRKARATFSIVRADSLNRADSRTRLTEAVERWSLRTTGASPAIAAMAARTALRPAALPVSCSSGTPRTWAVARY